MVELAREEVEAKGQKPKERFVNQAVELALNYWAIQWCAWESGVVGYVDPVQFMHVDGCETVNPEGESTGAKICDDSESEYEASPEKYRRGNQMVGYRVRNVHTAKLSHMAVDIALVNLGYPKVLADLLAHIYPTMGTYKREVRGETPYHDFRAESWQNHRHAVYGFNQNGDTDKGGRGHLMAIEDRFKRFLHRQMQGQMVA